MNKLIAFDPQFLQKFSISADLKIQSANTLQLHFELSDPLNEIDLESHNINEVGTQLNRENDLWKSTCFELFLNPVGEKKYFEFNFSLKPAWNNYVFDEYRKPQPVKLCSEFEIQKMSWQNKNLKIDILNLSVFQKFNVSLSAVIKNKKNQVSYFALVHAESKPDFHSLKSFQLQRGF